MAVLDIVHWPAEVLETESEEIKTFDKDLYKLSKDMHETMDHLGGIGLAANQVNILKKILVIYIPFVESKQSKPWHKASLAKPKFWHNKRYTFVNPKIISFEGKHSSMEGCLSFPENMDFVDRFVSVKVQYQDLKGKKQFIECSDLMSICLQHEIDHINGIVFTERMNAKASRQIKKNMQKYAKTSNTKI